MIASIGSTSSIGIGLASFKLEQAADRSQSMGLVVHQLAVFLKK
jgi:hypothetical protein